MHFLPNDRCEVCSRPSIQENFSHSNNAPVRHMYYANITSVVTWDQDCYPQEKVQFILPLQCYHLVMSFPVNL